MFDIHGMLDRITALSRSGNIQKKDLAKTIGISVTAFSDWNCGRGKPNIETVAKIAEFFDVSLDYLVFGIGTENNKSRSDLSNDVLARFDSLNPFNQTVASAYIDGLLASQRGNNNGV